MKTESIPYSRFYKIDRDGNVMINIPIVRMKNGTSTTVPIPVICGNCVTLMDDSMKMYTTDIVRLLADSFYGVSNIHACCNGLLHSRNIRFDIRDIRRIGSSYLIDGEEFKQIKGFSSYYISGRGAIFSEYMNSLMRQKSDKENGYKTVQLISDDGIAVCKKIHRLVFETWVCDIPPGMVINHINCNKGCNSVTNLELTTSFQNTRHANIHHLKKDAWDISTVYKVCEMMSNGLSVDEINASLHRPQCERRGVLSLCYRIANQEVYRDISSQFDIDFSLYRHEKTLMSKETVLSICKELQNGDWLSGKYRPYEIDKKLASIFNVSEVIIRSIRLKRRWHSVVEPFDFNIRDASSTTRES